MSYDTSKDPRLLVAQRACTVFRNALQRKSAARPAVPKQQVADLAGAAESAVMTLLYLYQEPAELATTVPAQDLVATAGELTQALQPVFTHRETPVLQRATLQWCLRVLAGLPERLLGNGTSLASGVDLLAVEVRNVTRLGGGLWLTRVSDGSQDYTVVTNLPGIRSGDTLGVAFLPPREVGGQVSEAMFLGAESRAEPAGTRLGEDQVDTHEVSGLLHDELARR